MLVILEVPSDGVGEPLWYLVVICMVAVMVADVVPALRRTAAPGDLAVQERIRAEAERDA